MASQSLFERLPSAMWVSPQCVGLGIEVENDRLATQFRQADRLAILVQQLELGGRVAGLDHRRIVAAARRRYLRSRDRRRSLSTRPSVWQKGQ